MKKDPSKPKLRYVPQAWCNVTIPVSLEMHIASPRSICEHQNIVRMWFPEVVETYDSKGKVWQWDTFHLQKSEWRKEGDILKSLKYIDDVALMTSTARWHGDQVDFELRFKNTTSQSWSRIFNHICLQLAAAPDYVDDEGIRTYLIVDGDFVQTSMLAITDPCLHGGRNFGAEIPMKDGSKKRVTEGVFFVISKDERYVLGYSWQEPEMFSYNRAGLVSCIHINPVIKNVDPQKEGVAKGMLFVMEGALEDAYKRYRTWQANLKL